MEDQTEESLPLKRTLFKKEGNRGDEEVVENTDSIETVVELNGEEEEVVENNESIETVVELNVEGEEVVEITEPIETVVEINVEESEDLGENDYEKAKEDIQSTESSPTRNIVLSELLSMNQKEESDKSRLEELVNIFTEMDEKKDVIPEIHTLLDTELGKIEYEIGMTTKYSLCWPTLCFYTLFSPITNCHFFLFTCCSFSSLWGIVLGLLILAGSDSFTTDDNDNLCDLNLISYLLVSGGVVGMMISICSCFSMIAQIWMHTRDTVNRENKEDHLNLQKKVKKDFCFYTSKGYQFFFLFIECFLMVPVVVILYVHTNVLMYFRDCSEADKSSNFLMWQITSYVLMILSCWVPILANCSRLFCR